MDARDQQFVRAGSESGDVPLPLEPRAGRGRASNTRLNNRHRSSRAAHLLPRRELCLPGARHRRAVELPGGVLAGHAVGPHRPELAPWQPRREVRGEHLHWHDTGWWINAGRGIFTFSAIPADVESRFPLDAWNDSSKWNLAGLDPLVIRYQQNYAQTGGDGIAQRGNCPVPDGCGNFSLNIPRPYWSAWFGDTWKVNSKLTVNYGLRYDLDWGVTAPPYITATTGSADTGAPQSVNDDLGFGSAGVFDVGALTTTSATRWASSPAAASPMTLAATRSSSFAEEPASITGSRPRSSPSTPSCSMGSACS